MDESGLLAAYLASLTYVDEAKQQHRLQAWLEAFAREVLTRGPLDVHRVSALFIAR